MGRYVRTIVFAKAYDPLAQKEIPLPVDLVRELGPGSALLWHPDVDSHVTGILLLSGGPIMVASQPVVTSKEEGPIRGTLVMGRNLDARAIRRLSERLLMPVEMRRLDSADLPADFRAVSSRLTGDGPAVVNPLDNGRVAGYALLNDVNQQPALLLRVDEPRVIYQQGQLAVAYVGLSLLIVCAVFGGVTWWLLEKQILERVSGLSGACKRSV